MKISEELQARKARLLTQTWVQRNPKNEEESCLVRDHTAIGTFAMSYVARKFLSEYLGRGAMGWNDMLGRTFGEVIDMLDEATIIAKEKGL